MQVEQREGMKRSAHPAGKLLHKAVLIWALCRLRGLPECLRLKAPLRLCSIQRCRLPLYVLSSGCHPAKPGRLEVTGEGLMRVTHFGAPLRFCSVQSGRFPPDVLPSGQ